jgi:hypothetical protein
LVLNDNTLRKEYDRGFRGDKNLVKCYSHQDQKAWGSVEKFFYKNQSGARKRNGCHFCSEFCVNQYFNRQTPNENPPPPQNSYNCSKCGRSGSDISDYRKWKKDGKTYCLKCLEKVKNPGNENTKKSYPKGAKGNQCPECEAKEASEWKEKPGGGKFYCYPRCWKQAFPGKEPEDTPPPRTPPHNPLQEVINKAVAEIQDALNEEPRVFRGELESRFQGYERAFARSVAPQQIIQLKEQVIAAIEAKRASKKKDDRKPDQDPLHSHRIDVIDAIEFFLSQKVPAVEINELEAVNQNYLEAIAGAHDEDQIDAIARRVLNNIVAVRQKKIKGQSPETILANLRQEAINLINQELKREPQISESDISHRNWEEDLENASEESQIAKIRDRILAEIKAKQDNLKGEGVIVELISKGQSVNSFEELAEIINRLKYYRSSDTYQKHETEIEALENKLKGLDTSKFNQQLGTNLEQQLKNNNLTKGETSKETQEAIDKAKKTGDLTDKKVAEAKISQDGAKKGLNTLVAKAKKTLTASKPEKEQMAREIENAIKKNKFWQDAYQKNKSQIDQLLSQLRGEQQQLQNPDSPKPTWPKALGIGLLIAAPLVLVGSLILLKKKRRL